MPKSALKTSLGFTSNASSMTGNSYPPSRDTWLTAVLTVDSKCREFVEGNNELLVSHSYPFADLEAFSTVCNFGPSSIHLS